jgi:hypothetical protein
MTQLPAVGRVGTMYGIYQRFGPPPPIFVLCTFTLSEHSSNDTPSLHICMHNITSTCLENFSFQFKLEQQTQDPECSLLPVFI